ncbi:GIY-YIG nuclease family protein [Acrocarpospora sp. B8E8]|uniref:GIY-YIG nuclease family protein n=1 Tax=Acrocarpospora sp. B8E8 TaxID=3153572 RepID=UPI00325E6A03
MDTYIANRVAADLGEVPDGPERVAQLAAHAAARAAAVRRKLANGPIDPKIDLVYYVQFSDRVKIGTTRNLTQRLLDVPHDRLLAIEPGGFTLERSRHAQFAALWVVGEWFRIEEPLTSHIADVRARNKAIQWG